jgi:formylglycine-generating enzyme required for sulfatase activity
LRAALILAAAVTTLGSAACNATPPGEVLVMVDTDLPAALGNRLRIDLFRPDGTWYAARDYPIPNLGGWPASFGVVSDNPNDVTPVYARLRVYPDGETRDYLGERYHDNTPIVPDYVPTNVADMCTNALALPVGGIVVGRRGQHAFIPMLSGDDCTTYNFANQTGTFAAYVDIATPGSYEFGILASEPLDDQPVSLGQPPPFPFNQATLQLRRACADDSSFIACDPGWGSATSAPDGNPRIVASLPAGRVYVLVGGIDAAAGPLEVAVAAWKAGSPPPGNDTIPARPLAQPIAAAVTNGPTPTSEPEPGVTIDRLVLLEVPPSRIVAARVTLSGACLGTMTKLGDTAIDLASAQTCVDASTSFGPVTPLSLDPNVAPAATLPRTFGVGTPCPPPDPTSTEVCVEGGPFILGGRNTTGGSPVRTVAVSTFWMDRYETTVGDYRASHLPADNADGPVGLVNGLDVGCTWSPAPGAKERYPLVCLSQDRARQYCLAQSLGGMPGDLPTEAQWEYAATVVSRPSKTLFPWGDDPPQCTCDGSTSPCHAPLFGRNLPNTPFLACHGMPSQLEPVGSRTDPTTGDRTSLGIVGMAGSVAEWMQDSTWPYASPCWYSASVIDPVCAEDNALLRSARGGGWTSNIDPLTAHDGAPPREAAAGIGLRCVHRSP